MRAYADPETRARRERPVRHDVATGSAQQHGRTSEDPTGLLNLQRLVGNRVVTSLLRSDDGTPALVQRKKGKGGGADLTTAIDQEHQKYVGNFGTPLSTEAPVDYKVTVAASMYMPEYLKFAKTRMKSTIRNTVRSAVRENIPGAGAFVRKHKTGKEIKEKAAIKTAGLPTGTATTDPAVKKIIENSDAVGHSWIKLSTLGATGAVIQTYSFGFLPDDPSVPHGPQEAVPGRVRNPDLEFESYSDHENIYLDTPVKAASYQKGLAKVAKLMANPPNYKTIGYNCTQFVKEVAREAGANFPGKAGMMIPISDRGFRKRALSPNALYGKLEANLGAEKTSKERDLLADDTYNYDDTSGIRQNVPLTTPSRVSALELFDPFDADGKDVTVRPSDMVIPTGEMNGSIRVEYEGKELYASSTSALIRHLEQQEPEPKSQHKLQGSLVVETGRGPQRTVKAGTVVRVGDVAAGDLEIEVGRPDMFNGTCGLIEFWEAVGGVKLQT
jgi:hypothetical protein